MKNKLKLLSVFLLALVLGFGIVNVKADDPADDSVCPEGQILHTNYYLFLERDYTTSYAERFEEDSTWIHRTEAPKYNNIYNNIIRPAVLVSQNSIKITNQDGSLTNFLDTTDITWTAVDFWKHFYDTNVYIARKGNVTRIYEPDQRTTYFMNMGNWREYVNGSTTTPTWTNEELYEGPTNEILSDELLVHIADNLENLANSDLVTKATIYPETAIIDYINPTKGGLYYAFRVSRTYKAQTVAGLEGILDGGKKNLYSPAAYYAQFCMKATTKKIEYKQNYEGEAPANMPEDSTYSTTCGDISEKTPERTGYEFLGWNTDKDADKPAMVEDADYQKYIPGGQYCDGEDTLTLYAIWKKKEVASGPFTVTYDANKGTDAPAPQQGDSSKNTCVKISDKGDMKLDKNEFMGWSTKEDAVEADKNYAPGTEYCGEYGDLTLYAVWNAKTGVSAHIIAFGLVAVSAVVTLIVAKKKNLFKQI